MQKISLFIPAVITAGLVLSGCSLTGSSSPQTDTSMSASDKQGETTRTGVITQAGSSFFITPDGGQPEIIESYAVELSEYVGQSVTITGQYSGDTLYVGSIQ